MTEVHWISDTSGRFENASEWSTGAVPGTGDDAILDAPGAADYSVSVGAPESTHGFGTDANATLLITPQGPLLVADGTSSNRNAGILDVTGIFQFSGTIVNVRSITDQNIVRVNSAGSLSGGGVLDLDAAFISGENEATLTNVDNTIQGQGEIGGGVGDGQALGSVDEVPHP